MTDVLVRLPDQFRPSRDTPMAATPTCCSCCCCCCCISTLITSSIVLPMRVELMARQSPSAPANRVGTSKMLAGLAPVAAVVMAIATARVSQDALFVLVASALAMAGMLALAFSPFGHAMRSVTATVAFVVAFVAEVFVGAFGILATAGIGYAIVAILAGIGVVRHHTRLLAGGDQGPGPGHGGARPPGSPPPPLPRPPSSGG